MKSKTEKSVDNKDKNNVTTTAVSDDIHFVSDDACYNLTSEDCSWMIDTGASYHLTTKKEYFSTYTSGNFGCVRMGNDGASKIIGIRDIC